MRARQLLLALVTVVVAAAGSVSLAGAQQPAGPSLDVDRQTIDRGETLRVSGEGWPAATVLTVELCGNEARDGSTDCDIRTSRTVATSAQGSMFVDLLVTAPPSPCPCVVRAYVPQGAIDLAVRVDVVGVPVVELDDEEDPVRALEVTEARLEGGTTLASAFGGAPERTLVLDIENTGEVPVSGVRVRAGWGRADDTSRVIEVDDLDRLEPGESVTVEAPFELTPLAAGRYTVAGGLVGFDDASFSERVDTQPVGLIALGLAVVALWTVRWWQRARRRRAAGDEGDETDAHDAEAEVDAGEDDADIPAGSPAATGEHDDAADPEVAPETDDSEPSGETPEAEAPDDGGGDAEVAEDGDEQVDDESGAGRGPT